MKIAVQSGRRDLYNPNLVPSSGIVGIASCEAGATFRYKNTWTMTNVAATTFDGLFCVNGTLWTTPNQPFMLDYIAVRYTSDLTGVYVAGPAFSTLSMAVEIDDTSGNHAIVSAPSATFTGTPATYSISAGRSLFTSVVDPGFVLTDYNTAIGDQNGAVGGTAGGVWPVFHAYSADWLAKPLWVAFVSQPSSWNLSGTLELEVCGRIFAP